MKSKFISILLLFLFLTVSGQKTTTLQLVLKDEVNNTLISNADIYIDSNPCNIIENPTGNYKVYCNLKAGVYELYIAHPEFESQKVTVSLKFNSENIQIGQLFLKPKNKIITNEFTLIDSLDQFTNEDEGGDALTQTPLSSQKNQFWNSVAFQWRGSFFKPRGLDSSENTILINGTKMNHIANGRFIWGTVSGLNTMMRSQELSFYTNANPYHFGGLQGVTAFQFQANQFRKGTYFSLSNTNSSYQGRLLANYNTGISHKNWAFSVLVSASYAKTGYIEGTSLKHAGGLFSAYKKLNKQHHLNFTTFFTPNNRGGNSPLTDEIINLKGRKYNPAWGKQNGKIRNSRIRKIVAPTFTLNHTWQPNHKIEIQNNLLFQHNETRNSRIDFNGRYFSKNGEKFKGASLNPDPTYYQKLPSYFLRKDNIDYEKVFLTQQDFLKDGQLNWESLYSRNSALPLSAYILYSNVSEYKTFAMNSFGQLQPHPNINLQYRVSYQNYTSSHYAQIDDLLGGIGYLDINAFETGDAAQSNLQQPNRVVNSGDIFRYYYDINSKSTSGFTQIEHTFKRIHSFLGFEAQSFSTVRIGLFENGLFPQNASLGKSDTYHTFSYKIKGGFTYNINNKWYVDINGFYGTSPPSTRKVFINPRQNNELVRDLKNLNQLSLDLNLRYQYDKWRFNFSGYHISQKDDTSIRFFFTEDIAGLGRGNNSEFVQQTITGIETLRQGIEMGMNYEVTHTLQLNAAAAYGKHIYTNNAQLQLSADSFDTPLDLGETRLKNYRLANGPQQAYGIGFTYRDPSYWWFNTQLNYFNDIYVSIAEILRTDNFATDIDGQPILNYDEERAKELLKQEQLPSYFVWNAIGGKSWKINNYYLGFTLGIQNILDEFYKTGGFEQARKGNFTSLNEERNQQFPLFGNRYWIGRGATYYMNIYVRF